MRVLVGIRQSKRRLASESPATQRLGIHQWAGANGHEIIGEAVDVGVSATIEPSQRKDLGPWLTEPAKLAQWDILAVWKLDRIARSHNHLFGKLLPQLRELNKSVVCVTENIDTSNVSAIELGVRSGIAEDELTKLTDRARESSARLRESGRWRGGRAPFGYRVKGKALVIDDDARRILLWIIEQLEDGENLNSLCRKLTDRGELTSSDRHEAAQGRKPLMRPWRRMGLYKMLRSQHYRGHQTHKDPATGAVDVVRDAEGEPVQFYPPVLSADEYARLQAQLHVPKQRRRRANSWMLTGVAYCAECGRSLYGHPGGNKDVRRYYCYCRSLPSSPRTYGCTSGTMRAEDLEQTVKINMVLAFGDAPVIDLVPRASVDPTKIRDLETQIDNVTGNLLSLTPGSRAAETVTARLNQLSAQLEELKRYSVETVEHVDTGQRWADLWDNADNTEKSHILRRHGVVVMARNRQDIDPPYWIRTSVPAIQPGQWLEHTTAFHHWLDASEDDWTELRRGEASP